MGLPPVTSLHPRASTQPGALMSSADCSAVSEARRSKIAASASASMAAVGSSRMSLDATRVRWWYRGNHQVEVVRWWLVLGG